MLYPMSPKVVDLKRKLENFMDRHIYPNEERFYREAEEARAMEGLSRRRGTEAARASGRSLEPVPAGVRTRRRPHQSRNTRRSAK